MLETIFVVLLILKLIGVVGISWWLVFSPLLCIAGAALFVFILAILGIVVVEKTK